MKYIKTFEAKIFGRKIDRNQYTDIDTINNGSNIPIIKKSFNDKKNLLNSLIYAFKTIYARYIDDKINFAGDVIDKTGIFDFDIKSKGRRFIKNSTTDTYKKLIIDIWSEFIEKYDIKDDDYITEYNFLKIVNILWKYKNGLINNSAEQIKLCSNELLKFLHNEFIDNYSINVIKIDDVHLNIMEKDFDEKLEEYRQKYGKDIKFEVDKDDNHVIIYVNK